MKKTLLLAGACLMLSAPSFADRIFGVYAGAYQWNQNYDGFIQDLDTAGGVGTSIDLGDDLGFDDEGGNVVYVALETFIPFVPNVKLQQTELEIDSTNAALSATFGDETFNFPVDADLDLSHTDVTLYWQILDNYVSADIGLTARVFKGELNIEQTGGGVSANEELDAVIPLVYAKARVDLPLSGVYAEVNGNFLGAGDNSFLDYEVKVGYESDFRVGVEAGFRSMELDLDDVDDVKADITIDGAFIGLFLHL